jgi:hypothetical protein
VPCADGQGHRPPRLAMPVRGGSWERGSKPASYGGARGGAGDPWVALGGAGRGLAAVLALAPADCSVGRGRTGAPGESGQQHLYGWPGGEARLPPHDARAPRPNYVARTELASVGTRGGTGTHDGTELHVFSACARA